MSWGGGESSGPGDKVDQSIKNAHPSLKKNADTHKMSPEQVKSLGVEESRRPPGSNPGGVLHQRGRMPFGSSTMVVAGVVVTAVIGYGVLYSKKKTEADAMDVARVVTNTAKPANSDFRPKK